MPSCTGTRPSGCPDRPGRQPDGRVPVHETDELQQRRGAERVGDRGVRRTGPRPSVSRPTGGCSRGRAPMPMTTGSCRTGGTSRSSPAMRLAGQALPRLAGVGVDDLTHVDLYSCFPSVVQIAVRGSASTARSAADRHRRPELRRRPVEQLRDALDRHDGRAPAGGRRRGGPVHGQRWLRDQARVRRLLAPARPPRRSATATCRPRSTPSPAASSPRTTPGAVIVETSTVMHDRDGNPGAGVAGHASSTTAAGPGPSAPMPI